MPFETKYAPLGQTFKKATSACHYEGDKITFILLTRFADPAEGVYLKTRAEKIHTLLKFKPTSQTILVAWPGEHHQDIFAITTTEQRDKALARFGLKPATAPAQTYTAADGTVFVEQ